MTMPPLREFYPAPSSRTLSLTTILGIVILLGGAGILFVAPDWRLELRFALAGLLIAIVVFCWLFSVRGYAIRMGTLEIHRPLWVTSLSIRDLQSAEIDPHAMKGSIRLCGNGGLFVFSGLFWNSRLRSFRAWVTDLKGTVVLRFPRRTIVLSPLEPEQFVAQLRAHSSI